MLHHKRIDGTRQHMDLTMNMDCEAYHRNAHGIWAFQGSEESLVEGGYANNDCKPNRNPDDHYYSILQISPPLYVSRGYHTFHYLYCFGNSINGRLRNQSIEMRWNNCLFYQI